jgi:hypothetical protein
VDYTGISPKLRQKTRRFWDFGGIYGEGRKIYKAENKCGADVIIDNCPDA